MDKAAIIAAISTLTVVEDCTDVYRAALAQSSALEKQANEALRAGLVLDLATTYSVGQQVRLVHTGYKMLDGKLGRVAEIHFPTAVGQAWCQVEVAVSCKIPQRIQRWGKPGIVTCRMDARYPAQNQIEPVE